MEQGRRTQADRTASTRQQLIDAVIASLIERGWAATTSVAVCERAGVTRGALVHHFDDLGGLLAAALESLAERWVVAEPTGPVTLRRAIDVTWARIDTAEFKAVIEAWMAAGNDPQLAAALAPSIERFAKLVSVDSLGPKVLRTREAKDWYLTAREAMLGLALGRASWGKQPLAHADRVLATLRRRADEIDSKGTR